MKNEELLELVITSLPYPEQIKDIDVSEPDAIRFTWRGDRFRVSNTTHVEQVDRGCLCGSNIAILLRRLIDKTDLLRNL